MKTVALQELDEQVRAFIAGLHEGDVVTIVDGARPVARLERPLGAIFTPVMTDELRAQRHAELIKRLETQPALNLGPFNRDELYDGD